MRVLDMVEDLTELVVPGDSAELLILAQDLITLRNATEHQVSVCAAVIDGLGLARKAGSTTSKLLQANGAAPASAQGGCGSGPGWRVWIAQQGGLVTGICRPSTSTRWSRA